MPPATGARLCALALAGPCVTGALAAPAQEPVVAARWETSIESPYAGQTFELSLVLELDDAWSRAALVQLYARELELPLQVDAFAGAPEGLALTPLQTPTGPTLVLDGSVESASSDQVTGDRRRVTVTRSARLTSSAPVRVMGPLVHFSAATSFREDLVQGKVPVDPQSASVRGESLELRARALPEAGRPVDFAGAIGAFELTSRITPRAFAVGDEVRLDVEVTGAGFLPGGEGPRLADLAGDYELLGSEDDGDAPTRTFTYHLRALRPGVEAAPRATLSTFDPAEEASPWRTLEAAGPPVAVRPGPGGPAGSGGGDDPEGGSLFFTVLTLSAIGALALLSAVKRIRHRAAQRAAADETSSGPFAGPGGGL